MKRFHVISAALLCGVFLLLLCPFSRGCRERRASSLALRYYAQTNLANASLSARRALQINSNCVAALRIMALLTERTRSPRALYWRRRVADLEPGRDSNHLDLARTALLFNQTATAKQALTALSKPGQHTNPEYHELAAQIAFASRDLDRSEQHLQTAAALDTTNATHQHNLHIVRLHSSDTTAVHQARVVLDGMRSDPTHGTAILRALVREALARLSLDRARDLSVELQQRRDVHFDDRLLHLTILQMLPIRPAATQLDADARTNSVHRSPIDPALADFIRQAQEEAASDPERVCALGSWLSSHDLADAALSWLETLPDEIRNATGVRLVETQCNLVLKNWRELASWLKQSHWGADEHLRHALLALVHRQEGDEQLATMEWKRAVRASHDGRHSVNKSQQALVRLAGAWSWENEAEALLWEIAAGPETRWALALLRRAYELAGDTRSLLRVFQAELTVNPTDLVARNNLAAACLLLGTNLPSAHQLAHEVYISQPTNASMACTYAYSIYLQGRTAEAVELMSGFSEAAVQNPSTAACYGLLLAAQGRGPEAEKYLARAQLGFLLPEERAMVEAAKRMMGR